MGGSTSGLMFPPISVGACSPYLFPFKIRQVPNSNYSPSSIIQLFNLYKTSTPQEISGLPKAARTTWHFGQVFFSHLG
jgi:hypothetical protein